WITAIEVTFSTKNRAFNSVAWVLIPKALRRKDGEEDRLSGSKGAAGQRGKFLTLRMVLLALVVAGWQAGYRIANKRFKLSSPQELEKLSRRYDKDLGKTEKIKPRRDQKEEGKEKEKEEEQQEEEEEEEEEREESEEENNNKD
ncbi:Hypothetical predicted protein, partial [Podarcis lilfordi]